MTGVDDLVVERRGRLRLKPQSPFEREEGGVLTESSTGCGRVAVSELNVTTDANSDAGRRRGAGMANILEARSRAPPGETDLVAIMMVAALKALVICKDQRLLRAELIRQSQWGSAGILAVRLGLELSS